MKITDITSRQSTEEPVERFIRKLYCEAPSIALNDFATWALDLLRQVIDFDGAVWGTGHTSTRTFHTHTTLDLSANIFDNILATAEINPLYQAIFDNIGTAVDMRDVIDDDAFYQSAIYQQVFSQYGIERILSSIHLNERSGVFTLLSLYRYDRDNVFSPQEKALQSRMLYHLISCASHRLSIELATGEKPITNVNATAICDAKGIYHAVSSEFLDIIESQLSPKQQPQNMAIFPFEFSSDINEFSQGSLQFQVEPHGELFKLTVRLKHCFDELSAREKQVVQGICQGSTFKQIAKALSLSPSTVSNHLYRIYTKLGVNTRSELVALAQKF